MSIDPRPARRAAVVAELAERDLGALVVTQPASVRYLTGYVGSNGVAVVGATGARLLTDFRYATSARGQLDDGVELILRKQDLMGGVPDAALAVSDGGRIGLEAAHTTMQQGARLQALLSESGMPAGVPVTGVVEGVRVVKDAEEVEGIARSAAVTDAALARVVQRGLVGRAERDVAWDILVALHELGAQGPSFDPIVAAGPNGAKPHAVPGEAVIPEDTLVVIDMGAIVDGYCSDMTRTFATGDPDARLLEAYRVCEQAQAAALQAVRAGAGGKDVDAVARDIITHAGFGPQFGHGLGHGVGLEIHEGPRLSTESQDTLRTGMIVTVEPGIYLKDIGGVRIEDLVVVTDDGCRVLSGFPKDPRAAG